MARCSSALLANKNERNNTLDGLRRGALAAGTYQRLLFKECDSTSPSWIFCEDYERDRRNSYVMPPGVPRKTLRRPGKRSYQQYARAERILSPTC